MTFWDWLNNNMICGGLLIIICLIVFYAIMELVYNMHRNGVVERMSKKSNTDGS